MVRFYIVRHGQPLLNCLDRVQGWVDSPLTEAGKQMAADMGRRRKSSKRFWRPPMLRRQRQTSSPSA